MGGVLQSRPVLPGHAAKWVANGVVSDGGGVNNGPPGTGLSEIGITNPGMGLALHNAPATEAFSSLSLGFQNGVPTVAVASTNGEATLQFDVNGEVYQFPGTGNGNVVGPNPTVPGDLVLWNNTSGTLVKDGGTDLSNFLVKPHGASNLIPLGEAISADIPLAEYGVVGDGTTDDTAALQAAVASGQNLAWRGTVGNLCLVSAPIVFTAKGQRISGYDRTTDGVLVASTFTTGNGVFDIETGETGPDIRDIGFTMPQPDTATRSSLIAYVPAIYVNASPRCTFDRIRIEAGQIGIDLVGNCGGTTISYLESSCFSKNIAIDGSFDTVRIIEPHIFPFALTANQQSIFYSSGSYGIYCGRCDDFIMEGGLILIGSAAKFYASGLGGTFGSISDTDFDTYGGLEVDAGTIQATGCTFTLGAGAAFAILRTGGNLTVSNPNIGASTVPSLGVVVDQTTDAASALVLTGGEISTGTFNVPAISITGAGAVCDITGVRISADPNTNLSTFRINATGGGGIISGCSFQNMAAGTTQNGIYVSSANWLVANNDLNGRAIDATSAPASVTPGTSATAFSQNVRVLLDFSYTSVVGIVRSIVLQGTTDGSGNLSLPHGIANLETRIKSISCFEKSGGGNAVLFTGVNVDTTNANVVSATASTPVKVLIDYFDSSLTW